MIRVLGLLLALLIAPALGQVSIPFPGPGGVATVTPIATPTSIGTTNTTVGVVGSQTLTTTASVPAGAMISVCIYLSTNNGISVSGVTDTAGNTYSRDEIATPDAAKVITQYRAVNVTALGSGGTITVTFTGNTSGAGNGTAIAGAYTTGVQAAPFDVAAYNTGNATNVTATTASLAQANEIAFGCVGTGNTGTYSGASGFTNINSFLVAGSNGRLAHDYRIVAATTAVSYTPTFSGTGNMGAVVGTFKGF